MLMGLCEFLFTKSDYLLKFGIPNIEKLSDYALFVFFNEAIFCGYCYN